MVNGVLLEESATADLPRLPDGWEYRELSELLEPSGLSYGIVQPGSDDPNGVPIVRVKDVRNGCIQVDEVMHVNKEIEAKYLRTRLSGNEILLTLVGSVGETAIASPSLAGWNVARAIAVIRIPEKLTSWVRYYLVSDLAQRFMRIWQTTTVQATLNLRDVKRLPIAIPPEGQRDAAVTVLKALDDKIAVNDRIATVADELVRARFADRSINSNGTIRIDELGTLVRDIIPAESLTRDENYVGLEHMPRRHMWLSTWESSDGIVSAKSRFTRGDILFGKLRPYFHKVGLTFIDGISSTDIFVVRPRRAALRGWLLAILSSDDVVTHASAVGDGTRMPRAKWSDLASYEVPWMGEGEAVEFSEFVSSLSNRVASACAESKTLAGLRDTLLPKLMSGEIRVRDAEKAVEEVT
jgi:type I restriction enzyme, S subunit